ncbi:MAG: type II toxin-antitoxin system HicB family antitoxin [Bacteroidota bacterium]
MKIQSNFTAIILKAKDGTFTGYVEEVPGVISQGNTLEETMEYLGDALQMMLKYYKEETRKIIRKSHSKVYKKETLSVG